MRRAVERAVTSRCLGTCLVIALLGSAAAYGAVRGGAYAAFVEANGTLPDVIARTCGFRIQAVTISGGHELRENEILNIAGIGPHSSLLFLDVAAIRKRLIKIPLVKEASVSKLYPNRLLIEIEERQPNALWQKNGVVSVVAADGTPIDDMRDARFERLPLVVGDGANEKLSDYLDILGAAAELRNRVRAGIYVSRRRWTLKMDNGVEIDLPESDPEGVIARLAHMEHDGHILEKDILSVDLRIPGRVVVRLTEDAAATRAASLASKTKKKGAGT
jgi:cell division protein FtsQ